MNLKEYNDWFKDNWLLLVTITLVILVALGTPALIQNAVNECENNTIYYLSHLSYYIE